MSNSDRAEVTTFDARTYTHTSTIEIKDNWPLYTLGQLTYALGQAINLESDALLMIDKSSPRHKHDNRYKVDGESHASIHRIRADIADVDLGRVPLVRNNRRLVGTGKHLCGAATGTIFGRPLRNGLGRH